jgi:protein-disulfide isomerase
MRPPLTRHYSTFSVGPKVVYLLIFLVLVSVRADAQMHASVSGGIETGNPKAAVKIEIYYDLQCPACSALQPIVKEVEQKFAGKIFVVFRHFPLDLPSHDKAVMAARMVEAAKQQGKGRLMLDIVLENQKKWMNDPRAETILFGYAGRLGLKMKQFRADYASDKILDPIVDDRAKGKALKVSATPTVFLNGRELTFAEAHDLENQISIALR